MTGGRPAWGRISSRMSSTFSISFAPCLIRRLVPREPADSIAPGTAKTERPCSEAIRAVMSEPLYSPASTTTTPSEIPLMRRFREGKFGALGGVPKGYSVTRAPRAAISAASASFSGG